MVKGAGEWASGKRDYGGKKRKAPRAANLIGTVTKTKTMGTKAKAKKGKGKGRSDTRYCYDCGEQGRIGVHTSRPTA